MTRRLLALLASTFFILAAIAVMPGLRGEVQKPTSKPSRKVPDLSRFPIADFSAAEPSDPGERSKRRERGKKYNASDWGVNPQSVSDNTVRVDSVDPNLPAFPTDQSTAVIIGTLTNSRAYLSTDKTGVYSVFTVSVEEVLKNSSKVTLSNGISIEVEREGGRVKFPSGRLHSYIVNEQSMPQPGLRYVFFLTGGNDEPVFQILTGYELSQGIVHPLDELSQPKAYESFETTSFLTELRTKIATP